MIVQVLRIFFATDVHGSDICWKKFISAAKFYNVDVLVLGGDMTGKAIVPIVADGRGRYRVELMEQVTTLQGEDDALAMEKTISNKGYYPVRLSQDEIAAFEQNPESVDSFFTRCVLERVKTWMEYAEAKLAGTNVQVYVCPGNDDVFEVDEAVRQADIVTLAEGRVVSLDDRLTMISTGWANRTPWNTHREMDEDDLARKIDIMAADIPEADACIFNMHCPAFGSGLDEAAELDEHMRPKFAGHVLASVGSKAVRAAIERYQPPLALFGHIHEARGISRIGKTLCINPGSSYEQGTLLGARIDFDGHKIVSHTLTSG
ncbi:MAG: metallophosphoesterase [Chloroflexota bacterium]